MNMNVIAFHLKLRNLCKCVSIGTGLAAGLTSSYFVVQYQRNVGINTDKTAQQNARYIWKWVNWKCREKIATCEDYMITYCYWLSLSPFFHYLDVTSVLISLANSENSFTHNFAVRLLAAVQFPEEINLKSYISKCTPAVMVGLARSDDIDRRWFPCEDSKFVIADDDVLGRKIDNILCVIRSVIGDKAYDPCSLWLIKRVLEQSLPPDPVTNTMVDLSTVRDNVEFSTDTKITFSENVLTYLEILRRYSNINHVSSNTSISRELADVLMQICSKYPHNKEILVASGNIIANLAVNECNVEIILNSGILNQLMEWKRSKFVSLRITASRILNNLDRCDRNSLCLLDGIYSIHPENRCKKLVDVDIVFIHGIRGSPFYTWRQNDSFMDNYTYCWPKDWLSVDCPNCRVVCVGYKSILSDWHLSCPQSKEEYSLDHQAENICKKLEQFGLGKRPIIWVTHSMGGLIAKKILVESKQEDIVNSTDGIVFYSVPHLGSPIATHSEKASYILFPSIEVNELSENSPKLKELHQKFSNLVKTKEIECIDFGESQPLSLPYIKLKSLVVPRNSSDVGYGRFLLADANHQDICKPVSKTDHRYLEVMGIVENVIRKHFPYKISKNEDR